MKRPLPRDIIYTSSCQMYSTWLAVCSFIEKLLTVLYNNLYRAKMGVVDPKWAWSQKFRARFVCNYIFSPPPTFIVFLHLCMLPELFAYPNTWILELAKGHRSLVPGTRLAKGVRINWLVELLQYYQPPPYVNSWICQLTTRIARSQAVN